MTESLCQPWRILFVDDNPDDRADAKAALLKGSHRRYEFIEASLAADALHLCAQLPALDCMVLDFDLPDADAFEVLASLPRDSDNTLLVPVVILTGSSRMALNREVLRAGAEDYVGKSWLGTESLTRAVENAIERHAMKVELRRERARQQVIADIEHAATGASSESMEALFERVRLLVHADIFFSHLVEAGAHGPMLRLNADAGINHQTRQHFLLFDTSQSVYGKAVERGEPVFRSDMQHSDDADTAILRGLGVQALASYPLQVADRVIGTLAFASCGHRFFGAEECDFMGLVVSLVGAAWERLDVLRKKESELRSLTDNSPDILTRFDRQFRHVFVNAAVTRATGRMPAEFIGKNNRELGMPEVMCVLLEQAMQQVFATGETQRVAFDYPALTGLRYFECQLVAEHRAGGGQIENILGITHDVTERRYLEQQREQLLEAERAARIESERAALIKDEFLATLSHELRTPLSAILGWANLLKRAPPSTELYRKGIDVIARNASNQAELIGDLLDMNRIVSGKLRMESALLDLNATAAAAIDSVAPTALTKGITLDLALAGEAPVMVLGDSARLQQILWNLLANAVKFTAPGGRVMLTLATGGDSVFVSVTDNGKGIDLAFLPYLFDRFSQADGSSARVHGGLGLGLSIVKNLLELHGGAVHVYSAGPGHGACFTAILPLASSGVVPVVSPVMAPARDITDNSWPGNVVTSEDLGELRGVLVLLVDDNADVLELGRRLLADHGATVTTAQSANEALQQIRRQVPDVLLSDIGMPVTDGYQLIGQVRLGIGLSEQRLPAIAVTAYARPQDHIRALQSGFQACIEKPIRPLLLIRALLDLPTVKARILARSTVPADGVSTR
ncbi:response regulator [Actimicrobium antarcticum]|uniref:histidine kinase n=1 Tax=Actimicrobium antarcticum TaxID=1051899 RepID=A0ABP7TXQ5_9BURK